MSTSIAAPAAGEHHAPLHGAFGQDAFGRAAERFARAFGTPRFIVGQTAVVAVWIIVNSVGIAMHWDPYPFILLNLAFSTQAAYAAPLILLAQTRQADRDKARAEVDAAHREAVERHSNTLLEKNSRLIEQLGALTERVAAMQAAVGQ